MTAVELSKEKIAEKPILTRDDKLKLRRHRFVNPFIIQPKPLGSSVPYDDDDHIVVDRMDVDKETLVAFPVFGKQSWQEEIDANVSNCGMELMKSQLRAGLAKREDFYDDGKVNFDSSVIPETVHDARKKADQLNTDISSLAKAIGLDDSQALTADQFISKLTDAIKAKWNEQQQTVVTQGDQQ